MSKTIVIAQGACSPIRPKVITALKPYGYKVGHKFEIESYSLGYDWERGEDGKPIDQDWSKTQANVAEITVSDARASWTEFLICCTGAFQLMSPPIDPRNQIWAQEWHKLPRGWTQTGCKHDGAGAAAERVAIGAMPRPWEDSARRASHKAPGAGGGISSGRRLERTERRSRAARQPRRRRGRA